TITQFRGSAAELSTIRANLTERLQESNTKLVSAIEERDQLKANLTEMTEELKRLQSLSKQNRTCPAGWRMFDSTCYFFSTTSASWEQSSQDCRDKGADLVVIESYEEQVVNCSLKSSTKETWIGLNDREKEGVWKWIDETPLTQASDFLCHIFPQYDFLEEIYGGDLTFFHSRRSSERRFHGVIILLLGLLSVFLLAGLIGLTVHYHYSVRGSAAELSTIRVNLTERLQESNTKLVSAIEERDQLKANLTEMTKELKRLQSLSKQSERLVAGSLPTGPGRAQPEMDVGPPSSRLTTRRKVHEGAGAMWFG
ncbi:hypothetical protein L3Q82_017308, partial [Scortum barcoo]